MTYAVELGLVGMTLWIMGVLFGVGISKNQLHIAIRKTLPFVSFFVLIKVVLPGNTFARFSFM